MESVFDGNILDQSLLAGIPEVMACHLLASHALAGECLLVYSLAYSLYDSRDGRLGG